MTTPDVLAALAEAIRSAPVDELPRLAGILAEAQARLALRLAAPTFSGIGRPEEPERLLTLPEVAEILGVPEDRAYDLARRRELPVVTIGRYKRVRASALRAYVGENEQKALDERLSVSLSSLHDRGRGKADQEAARADAGRVRKAGRGSQRHRQPVGDGRAGAPGHVGEATAAARRAEEG